MSAHAEKTQIKIQVLALAGAAAALAACGGEKREPKDAAPAAVSPSPVSDGQWFYKESNGYPWAGYGPPRSEAFFVISCEGGRLVFQRADGRGPVGGEQAFRVRTADGAGEIRMEDAGAELPMLSGAAPPDGSLARLLLDADAPFAVEGGGGDIVLPPDESYRRVIRACSSG